AEWLYKLRPISDAVIINTPDGNHDPILNVIKQAKSRIQMSMYHLTSPDVIQALIDAQARGVKVQVILDRSSMKNPRYLDVYNQLRAARVDAMASTPEFTLTHSKTFVVDRKIAFVS